MAFGVLFVCTGNICRSPLAHSVFDHLVRERGLDGRFRTESAGTHGYHTGDNADPRMISCAARHGIRLDHRARKVEQSWFHDYAIVLAMGQDHLQVLQILAGSARSPTVLPYRYFDPLLPKGLSPEEVPEVPDPYYGSRADFEEVFAIVERTTPRLLDHLCSLG